MMSSRLVSIKKGSFYFDVLRVKALQNSDDMFKTHSDNVHQYKCCNSQHVLSHFLSLTEHDSKDLQF